MHLIRLNVLVIGQGLARICDHLSPDDKLKYNDIRVLSDTRRRQRSLLDCFQEITLRTALVVDLRLFE